MQDPFFHRKVITGISYYLILDAIKMPKIQFEVNASNGIAIDVANDACSFGLVD